MLGRGLHNGAGCPTRHRVARTWSNASPGAASGCSGGGMLLLLLLGCLMCLVCLCGGRRGRAGGESGAEAPAGRDEPFIPRTVSGWSGSWIVEHGAQLPWSSKPRSIGQIPWWRAWPTSGATTRQTEEPRKTARDKHLSFFFLLHRRRSGVSVSNAKDGNGTRATRVRSIAPTLHAPLSKVLCTSSI